MLILTRKVGQQIQIGDITITITHTGSHCTRIGIDAPADVPIRRVEIENRNSLTSVPDDDVVIRNARPASNSSS